MMSKIQRRRWRFLQRRSKKSLYLLSGERALERYIGVLVSFGFLVYVHSGRAGLHMRRPGGSAGLGSREYFEILR